MSHRLTQNRKLAWGGVIPFVAIHVACLGVFFVEFNKWAAILCGFLYVSRMFFITAFYHRFFHTGHLRRRRHDGFYGASRMYCRAAWSTMVGQSSPATSYPFGYTKRSPLS
ncbi:MAG: hypothetical protein CM1200mP41_28730 [Gammaproteobacteria bacterium]|nr:MAG: hypothetical protein CM1200mP41_28730 [Gammaproteobacteria bacterium]